MRAIDTIIADLDTTTAWAPELYRSLHAHPELSMQESATIAEIARRLASFGHEVHLVGGGVVGILRNGDGPTVLYRADVDGLPIQETTGLPHASAATMTDRQGRLQPVMHACGHDLHTVAALGAAAALAAHREAWAGTHVALFQPGEETAEGARSMLDAGLADLCSPDIALAQHVLVTPEAGKVSVAAGPVLSTAVNLTVTIHGKGSHGSMPHLGIDPVVVAAAIVLRLQSIVARELAPGTFGIVTVGALQAGQQANIIPDSATLQINLRAYADDVLEALVAAVTRIANAECEAARCPQPPTITRSGHFPLTDNDPDAAARVRAAFEAHFGTANVETMTPQTASEDFSWLPRAFEIPYVYSGVGAYASGEEPFPNHNPRFGPTMPVALRTGTEAALAATLAFLATPQD